MGARPEPATVVPKHPLLASGDNAAAQIYASQILEQETPSLRNESSKIVKLRQKSYERPHDRHVRFGPILNEGSEFHLDRPSLFCSAIQKSAAEGYNELLPKKKRPYKIVGVNSNLLRLLQDGLRNTVSNHRATLASPPI